MRPFHPPAARRLAWAVLLLSLLGTCADIPDTPTYAFYHWRTHLAPDPAERALLDTFSADRLYVKAFDVALTDGRPAPTALLEFGDTSDLPELVPVVFLTEAVFRQPAPDLARQCAGLLRELLPNGFRELQLDCDWTAGTRVRYFSFLRDLRTEFPVATLSATVRLHQYRDRDAQGIPPVDRAVLMAYNTGDLGSWATENSIVDRRVINGYVDGQPPYPLPLDLAVAVYDWMAVYRRDELAYLINEPPLAELEDSARFGRLAPHRYAVDSSTYYAGLYLYRGDRLRREIADRATGEALARELWPRIATRGSRRVIFYRLGSRAWRPVD